jgi:hypothetical protein
MQGHLSYYSTKNTDISNASFVAALARALAPIDLERNRAFQLPP